MTEADGEPAAPVRVQGRVVALASHALRAHGLVLGLGAASAVLQDLGCASSVSSCHSRESLHGGSRRLEAGGETG